MLSACGIRNCSTTLSPAWPSMEPPTPPRPSLSPRIPTSRSKRYLAELRSRRWLERGRELDLGDDRVLGGRMLVLIAAQLDQLRWSLNTSYVLEGESRVPTFR